MDSRFDHLEPNSPEEARLLAGCFKEHKTGAIHRVILRPVIACKQRSGSGS
jgi:hypothetical protein